MKKSWIEYLSRKSPLMPLYFIFIILFLLPSCSTKRIYMEPQLYVMTNGGRSWDSYYFTDKWGNAVQNEKRFRMAYQFSNGLACVQEPNERGKWGYVNEKLELVIPYQFDWAGSFGSMYEDEFAWVKYNLDEENRERIPTLAFGSAMIINKKGQQVSKVYGFMHTGSLDSYGIILVNDGHNFASTAGLHTYSTDGYWGGINGKGEEIIPCIYEFMIPMDRRVFLVRKGGKWGAINSNGKVLVPLIYDGIIYDNDHEAFNSFEEIDDKPFPLPKNLEPGKFNFIASDGSIKGVEF